VANKTRAFGRSLSDFPKLNDAEKELVEAAGEGRFAVFGDKIPETGEEKKTRTIRAGLVRFLALGGDDSTPVHEQGVQIRGAVVDGGLNFEACTLGGDLLLLDCELTGALGLYGAKTGSINLGGSCCHDINADRAEISGGLFLRNKFVAKGVVRLLGAKIAGVFDCSDARFEGRDDDGESLICDGALVEGGIFFLQGFAATGTVRMVYTKSLKA
jgi:hypothetical protein